MKKIPLTQGKFALVDDEDYDFLMQWKWCYAKDKNAGYAVRSSTKKEGYKRTILMHREILKLHGLAQGDHRFGNRLDNRKKNLRPATHAQNMCNRLPTGKGTSRYKGVSWSKTSIKWKSAIAVGGKDYHLGYFPKDKEVEAAKAYNVAALKYHGKFARLNIF